MISSEPNPLSHMPELTRAERSRYLSERLKELSALRRPPQARGERLSLRDPSKFGPRWKVSFWRRIFGT